jgi:hypothetical protein
MNPGDRDRFLIRRMPGRVSRVQRLGLVLAIVIAVLAAQLSLVPARAMAEPAGSAAEAPRVTRFWVYHPMYLMSGTYLYPVEYYVPELSDPESAELKAEEAMKALIRGMPQGTGYRFISLPETTEVLDLTIDDGICTVDLSDDILQANVGSGGEVALLDAIVCTLAQGLEVDKVEILIEGQPAETLAGHVDITGPLEPHWDRIYRGFEDSYQHWAGGSIMLLQSMDIMVGYEDWTSRPDEQLTRAQFVKMLVEILALPEAPDHDVPFGDLDGHWSLPYVRKALAAGVIEALDYGSSFGPDQVIPREEMAFLLVPSQEAYAEANPGIVYPDPAEAPEFTDESTIDPKYVDRVKECAELGLLQGYPEGNFGPERGLTRGEAATVLTRLMGIAGSGTWIVVATPRPGAKLEEGPIVALGSVAAFEGTTNFRFLDAERGVCFDSFTTATNGMGFGAYGVSVDRSLLTGTPTLLEVYLISAKDGSEFRLTGVPIEMKGASGE